MSNADETIAQEMRDYMAFGIEGAPDYADEHDNGQLRIAVAGEQVPLLPLPDAAIPQRCHLCHHGADEGHALSCPTRWY